MPLHCPRNVAYSARDFSTRKQSDEARWWEAAVEDNYTQCWARRGAQFIAHSECEACRTSKLLPLHVASPANHHMKTGFRWRHGDGFCVSEGIQRQIGIFDVISRCKAICVPMLPRVKWFFISVTKLWDMIIRLSMCKGQTHHAKVSESKSVRKTANTFDFYLPITVQWQSKSHISDEIDSQNISEWCHTSHRKRGQCPIRICRNDDHHAAFIHPANCIILRTDLVHIVEIFEIASGMSWKSRRRSWMS